MEREMKVDEAFGKYEQMNEKFSENKYGKRETECELGRI